MSRPNDGTTHHTGMGYDNWSIEGFGYPMMSLHALIITSTILCGNYIEHPGTGFERRLIQDNTKTERIDRLVSLVVSLDHLTE